VLKRAHLVLLDKRPVLCRSLDSAAAVSRLAVGGVECLNRTPVRKEQRLWVGVVCSNVKPSPSRCEKHLPRPDVIWFRCHGVPRQQNNMVAHPTHNAPKITHTQGRVAKGLGSPPVQSHCLHSSPAPPPPPFSLAALVLWCRIGCIGSSLQTHSPSKLTVPSGFRAFACFLPDNSALSAVPQRPGVLLGFRAYVIPGSGADGMWDVGCQ